MKGPKLVTTKGKSSPTSRRCKSYREKRRGRKKTSHLPSSRRKEGGTRTQQEGWPRSVADQTRNNGGEKKNWALTVSVFIKKAPQNPLSILDSNGKGGKKTAPMASGHGFLFPSIQKKKKVIPSFSREDQKGQKSEGVSLHDLQGIRFGGKSGKKAGLHSHSSSEYESQGKGKT